MMSNDDSKMVNIADIVRFVIKDQETFFTPAQRSRIAYEILMRARFDDNVPTKFGL